MVPGVILFMSTIFKSNFNSSSFVVDLKVEDFIIHGKYTPVN